MFLEELERRGLVKGNEEACKIMEKVCEEYKGRD
jgi:hypothetical protein